MPERRGSAGSAPKRQKRTASETQPMAATASPPRNPHLRSATSTRRVVERGGAAAGLGLAGFFADTDILEVGCTLRASLADAGRRVISARCVGAWGGGHGRVRRRGHVAL